MAGAHNLIQNYAVACAPQCLQSTLGPLIAFVLRSQWVAHLDSGASARVTTGAGMGISCAGELADATLIVMETRCCCNRNFANCMVW